MKREDVIYQRDDVVVSFIVGIGVGACAFAVGFVLFMQFLQAVSQ